MVSCWQSYLKSLSLSSEQIELFIGHQANARILEAVGKQLNIDKDKLFKNIDYYGDTSSASIPIALCEVLHQGLIAEKKTILLAAFGADYSFGATVMKASSCSPVMCPEDHEELEQELTGMQILRQAINADLKVT